jgi:hypothetical protein
MKIVKEPWKFGEEQDSQGAQKFSLPDFCVGDHLLVKLGPPKGKEAKAGLVAGFVMTSFVDSDGNTIELVTAAETVSGFEIKFPLGKRGLFATKYRGPKSQCRFLDKETNKFYQIPADRFTLEGAMSYCEQNVEGWTGMSDIEKDQYLDEYFADMFMFGMSQDLALPIQGDNFIEPFVGLQTKLYRTYTPPLEGEKYGNIIISKWRKGYKALDSEYITKNASLAEAIYEEYQVREKSSDSFDPTKVEEDSDVI